MMARAYADMEIAHPFDFRKLATDGVTSEPTRLDTRPRDTRKEKSRDAARSRRGKENHEFYELARLLPLPGAITSQLDKASIVRLTLSFLKIGEFSRQGDPPWDSEVSRDTLQRGPHIRLRGVPTSIADAYDYHQGTHILQSVDGFAFSLGPDGRFLYVSETVSIYLGLSQVEMCGSSIFDYIHTEDHAEFAELAGLGLSHGRPLASPGEENAGPVGTHNPDVNGAMTVETTGGFRGLERALCVRMKSTLTKRGCHFKTPGYRAMQLQCRLRPAADSTCSPAPRSPGSPRGHHNRLLGMVGLAVALPPPSVHELRLDGHTFVTRVTFDFQIVHCEPRVPSAVDFSSESLVGRNLYTLCHGADVCHLRQSHHDLLSKGQVLTGYYRLLNQNGGFTWLQTCATVVCHNKTDQQPIVVCVNYVISRAEFEGVIMEGSLLGDGVSLKTDSTSVEQELPLTRGNSDQCRQDAVDGRRDSPLAGRNSGCPGSQPGLGTVKREIEMGLSYSTLDSADHLTPPEPPRGEKRNYSSIISPRGGSYDCLPAATCGPDCSCGDSPEWRRRRRRDSGPDGTFSPAAAAAPATGCRPEPWVGPPPPGAGRRSVIRSGGQTDLMPTPPGGEATAESAFCRVPLPGPAGFTPPASVSPQEPPPTCGSPLGRGPPPACGSPLGPRLPPCGSPLGPGPPPACGSPLGPRLPPCGSPLGPGPPPTCGSPLGPGPPPACGSPLGPRYQGCESPLGRAQIACESPVGQCPTTCGSPLGQGSSPCGPSLCRSPLGLGPPLGETPQVSHAMHLMERTPLEALRSFWYVPHSP